MTQSPEQADRAGAAKLLFVPDEGGHRHDVVGIRSMLQAKDKAKCEYGKTGCFEHQQILGSCSPDDNSRILN